MAQQTGTILACMGHRCSERPIRFTKLPTQTLCRPLARGDKAEREQNGEREPQDLRVGEASTAGHGIRPEGRNGKRRQRATGMSTWLPRFYWRHSR